MVHYKKVNYSYIQFHSYSNDYYPLSPFLIIYESGLHKYIFCHLIKKQSHKKTRLCVYKWHMLL